jgi:hypothetical protein
MYCSQACKVATFRSRHRVGTIIGAHRQRGGPKLHDGRTEPGGGRAGRHRLGTSRQCTGDASATGTDGSDAVAEVVVSVAAAGPVGTVAASAAKAAT